MSAGYSYYSIDIFDENNKPDFEKAKEIFDWCIDHFDWFSDAVDNDILVLNHNCISTDTDWDTKHHEDQETIESLDWLRDVYENCKPAQMKATLLLDYGESSLDSYSRYKGSVKTNYKGQTGFYYHCTNYFCGNGWWGEHDSGWNYIYCDEDFNAVSVCLREKSTGDLVLDGNVRAMPAECESYEDAEDADLFSACCSEEFKLFVDAGGDYYNLLNKDGELILNTWDFDHFSDTDALMNSLGYDPSEYEFVGLGVLGDDDKPIIVKKVENLASADQSASQSISSSGSNVFVDTRDNNSYGTITIGDQVWTTENLRFKTAGSLAYNNDESNVATAGRLYTWDEAVSAIPAGWRLPTKQDFEKLKAYVEAQGHKYKVGNALKAASVWPGNTAGTDAVGFKGTPAGYHNGYSFADFDKHAYYWTATESGSSVASNFELSNYGNDFMGTVHSKKYALSIRLVKDA